jgi:hypothetical protein
MFDLHPEYLNYFTVLQSPKEEGEALGLVQYASFEVVSSLLILGQNIVQMMIQTSH